MEGILSRQDKPQPVCLAKKFGPSHGVSGDLLNGLCVYVCVCVCVYNFCLFLAAPGLCSSTLTSGA